MNKTLLLLYFLSIHSFFAYSQESVVLDAKSRQVPIGKYLYIYKDSSKTLNFEQVQAIPIENFTRSAVDAPSLGFSKANYWVIFGLQNNNEETSEWFLEFNYPLIDHIDLYYLDDNEQWQKMESGDKMPFSTRLISYRNVILPIRQAPGEKRTYYVRIETESSVQLPLVLYNSAALQGDIANTELFFGVFYGTLLIMLIYNLVLYFAIKNISYLYYCLYTFIYGIAQASLWGHPVHYFWGDAIWWANAVTPIGICAGITTATLFSIHFLDTKRFVPKLNKVLWALVIIFAIETLICFFLPYIIAIHIATYSILLTSIILLVAGVIVWIAGNRAAQYFVIAWTVFLFGLAMVALIALGVVPNIPILRNSTLIGTMVQVVLLSFALADRVNTIRRDKEKAQALSLQAAKENERIIREQNEMLEKKVKERTSELQQKQEEIMVQNEELHQQQEEILAQRDFIGQKNTELNEINDQMKQSIQYASKIQKALLPTEEVIKKHVQDCFILYIPRDVVSGDFYWFSQIEGKLFFAAVDCTGHGVPGAFMSMIGHTILSEIVNENRIFDPARILEMLHEGIVKALKQHESGNTDGMDVCLCRVEPQSDGQHFDLTFAGAKRQLYIFQNKEISEIKGDRFTVGGTQLVQEVNFENHHLQLTKGDCIYLSTDGFIDTPNPDREKFGSEKFKTRLLTYAKENMFLQKKFMHEELKFHKRGAVQRDDITLMGIRF